MPGCGKTGTLSTLAGVLGAAADVVIINCQQPTSLAQVCETTSALKTRVVLKKKGVGGLCVFACMCVYVCVYVKELFPHVKPPGTE